MTYEAWRIGHQSSEQAARAAYQRVEELSQKIKELEAQIAAVQHSSDRDSHFFVAGWNARNEGLDPTEQFKRAVQAKQGEQANG